jgi:signal transduction histidine kinase
MNREEALADLSSEHSERRLDAVRALARLARPEDEALLRAALSKESTVWVRRALERALTMSTSASLPEIEIDVGDDDPAVRKAHLVAVREISKRLVHELRSVLGIVNYWASKEIEDYGESRTRRHLDRLSTCLGAIDELGRASVMARVEEFALAPLIADEVEGATQELSSSTEVQLVGPTELVAHGDPALVRLIVRNAIVNAIEASAKIAEPVVVTWGATDRDYWVVVLDRAGALPANVGRLFTFGASTKTDHLGAGLALVRQAALALGGVSELATTGEGSTRFEVHWPRPDRTQT